MNAVDREGRPLAACETRERCAVCGAGELQDRLVVERVPVYMGVTDGAPSEDAFADQRWAVCRTCGCVQLTELAPLELVYLAQHNAAIGGVWGRHHRTLGAFVADRGPRAVVEVGGASGLIAQQYVDEHEIESWTVVEPNPTFTPSPPISVVQAYVEDVPDTVRGADTIVHSHLLEHLYHPRDLLATLRQETSEDAQMVFSVPDLDTLLAHSGANALNFEHTYYFGIPTLLWMLQDAGFELDELRRFERHSIMVAALARATAGEARRPPDASAGAEAFIAFVEGAKTDAQALAERAAAFDGDVFLFGGHVFSQFLIGCGFPQARATAIFDNDPAKQGRRLYGTDLTVRAPQEVVEFERAAVIVRAAHYTAEITAQLRELAPHVEVW